MKPLPEKFRSHGYNFAQIKRGGDLCIYSKSKGKFTGYEVFWVRKFPTYEVGGAVIEAHEAQPANEQWGSLGFSCSGLEEANKKFDQLLKRKKSENS